MAPILIWVTAPLGAAVAAGCAGAADVAAVVAAGCAGADVAGALVGAGADVGAAGAGAHAISRIRAVTSRARTTNRFIFLSSFRLETTMGRGPVNIAYHVIARDGLGP